MNELKHANGFLDTSHLDSDMLHVEMDIHNGTGHIAYTIELSSKQNQKSHVTQKFAYIILMTFN